MSSRTRAAFHAHLDDCQQCANHPFALCSEGARLLELAGQPLACLKCGQPWTETTTGAEPCAAGGQCEIEGLR